MTTSDLEPSSAFRLFYIDLERIPSRHRVVNYPRRQAAAGDPLILILDRAKPGLRQGFAFGKTLGIEIDHIKFEARQHLPPLLH